MERLYYYSHYHCPASCRTSVAADRKLNFTTFQTYSRNPSRLAGNGYSRSEGL